MRAVWVPLTGAVAVALTTIALLPVNIEAQQSITIALSPQNNSGQSGTAVLTADGAGTKVVITLSNAPGPHPAHIHDGACPDPGAVVYDAMEAGRAEPPHPGARRTVSGPGARTRGGFRHAGPWAAAPPRRGLEAPLHARLTFALCCPLLNVARAPAVSLASRSATSPIPR